MDVKDYIKSYKRNQEYNTLLFWHGPLSQWWYSPFEVEGVKFNCAEQYMMAMKASVFGDEEIYLEIMRADGPHTTQKDFTQYPRAQKALGRKVRGFDSGVWNAVAKPIVLRGNLAKFSQDTNLLEALGMTKGFTLVEASPYDRVWGVGMDDTNPLAFNPNTWDGTNWLGEVLDETRDYLIPKSILI